MWHTCAQVYMYIVVIYFCYNSNLKQLCKFIHADWLNAYLDAPVSIFLSNPSVVLEDECHF